MERRGGATAEGPVVPPLPLLAASQDLGSATGARPWQERLFLYVGIPEDAKQSAAYQDLSLSFFFLPTNHGKINTENANKKKHRVGLIPVRWWKGHF